NSVPPISRRTYLRCSAISWGPRRSLGSIGHAGGVGAGRRLVSRCSRKPGEQARSAFCQTPRQSIFRRLPRNRCVAFSPLVLVTIVHRSLRSRAELFYLQRLGPEARHEARHGSVKLSFLLGRPGTRGIIEYRNGEGIHGVAIAGALQFLQAAENVFAAAR